MPTLTPQYKSGFSNSSKSSFRRLAFIAPLMLALAACGGGNDAPTVNNPPPADNGGGGGATTFAIGVTINGLPASNSIVLQNNGGDDLTANANGNFFFKTTLATATKYTVTIKTPPAGALCSLSNASGTTAGANVTNISVDCVSTAVLGTTTGTTAFSVLSVGTARLAMVPRNSFSAPGVQPLVVDGVSQLIGTYVKTTIPVVACSTDSVNQKAVCYNYSSTKVAILDLAKFATTLNVADIDVKEFDTGAPANYTGFSGVSCILCGAMALSQQESFVVSAYDGYRVYSYPAATTAAGTTLTAAKIYAMPISENFAFSTTYQWLISPDYNRASGETFRKLRIIDLVAKTVYTWTTPTDQCQSADGQACSNFRSVTDAAAFADDTGLLTLVNEDGDAQLTVDMSQAKFDAATGTFTAPYAYADYSVIRQIGYAEMTGLLASSIGHWSFTLAEFDTWMGVQPMPASGGSGGTFTLPAPNPAYLDLRSLDNKPCTGSLLYGSDPHAQGYTVTAGGTPLGLFVSGNSACVAVIDLEKVYNTPRMAAPNTNRVDITKLPAGAVTFYAVP
ncbi:MAG: hypothetical protein LBF16_06435 [Pseudomonadales bacterium]|jgi:hypothetical protein|nr:hypothetical protein [Pseudomonadales bacterium]